MSEPSLEELSRVAAREWEASPYYELAEAHMAPQWDSIIRPFLDGSDFSHALELGPGRGRNSARLLPLAKTLLLVDVVEANLAACRSRFAGDPRLRCRLNDGYTLSAVPDASVTLVYCWDSMVHFDRRVVASYLREFRRVLSPRGRAFCHHSNYSAAPDSDYHFNPHSRAHMSLELFAALAAEAGLRLLRHQALTWGGMADLDGLALLERP